MTLPANVNTSNLAGPTNDPKQARPDLYDLATKFNSLLAHLNASPVTQGDPTGVLRLGIGLRADGSGNFMSAGGINRMTWPTSTGYAAAATDAGALMSSSSAGGAATFTLPNPGSVWNGFTIGVLKWGNNVAITVSGGSGLVGPGTTKSSMTLTTDGSYAIFMANGSSYFLVDGSLDTYQNFGQQTGGLHNWQLLTGGSSWVAPAGTNLVFIGMIGGGGGGTYSVGGGGAGMTCAIMGALTPGQGYGYAIGGGGSPAGYNGSGSNQAGGGGWTQFNGLYAAGAPGGGNNGNVGGGGEWNGVTWGGNWCILSTRAGYGSGANMTSQRGGDGGGVVGGGAGGSGSTGTGANGGAYGGGGGGGGYNGSYNGGGWGAQGCIFLAW